ncbi:MAG: hypothetical protein KDA21_01445 [Phycisphaerales bacterium]|nr:hypothetical protein [Phycisphaerales bacterium]
MNWGIVLWWIGSKGVRCEAWLCRVEGGKVAGREGHMVALAEMMNESHAAAKSGITYEARMI